MDSKKLNFVFFGVSELSVKVLDILIKNGYMPDLVITTPDKPKGRKMIMTPPPVKQHMANSGWQIGIEQLEKLSAISHKLSAIRPDLFIVASYGKIIPKSILDIPKFGTLNVHPSLLPKFRGPSPVQSFILSGEKETGTTIMLMDEQVDHGQIVSISKIKSQISNLNAKQLEEKLAELGGQMLVDIIPKWISGEIKPTEQDRNQATFTKKITKEDGLVDLEKDKPEIIYKKFLAYYSWPGIYYFAEKNSKKIRVIITDMELSETGKLKINKVKPEGKNEMEFEIFSKIFKNE